MTAIRNRVLELKRVKASELAPHPHNWRLHSETQRKGFRAISTEIGFAGAALAYYSERNGKRLTLIDGHLRQQESGEQEIPVIITDLTDAEADKLLAVYDPLAAMSGTNKETLDALVSSIQPGSNEMGELLKDISARYGSTLTIETEGIQGFAEGSQFGSSFRITIPLDELKANDEAFKQSLSDFCSTYSLTYKIHR